MPHTMIPPILGTCFAFVWMFIAAMVVREGQLAVRRDREQAPPEPDNRRTRPVPRPHFKRRHGKVRAARSC